MQLATIPLPAASIPGLKDRLWDEYQIEIPVGMRHDLASLRISIQAYNRQEDVDRLVEVLSKVL